MKMIPVLDIINELNLNTINISDECVSKNDPDCENEVLLFATLLLEFEMIKNKFISDLRLHFSKENTKDWFYLFLHFELRKCRLNFEYFLYHFSSGKKIIFKINYINLKLYDCF
jgi:hypothetical protein